MKLSTELKELPIISIAQGEEFGTVKDLIVDPEAKAVVALVIADRTWYEGAKVISFSDVDSIGDYAITTENTEAVVELTSTPELIDLLKREIRVVGARVITRGGRLVGTVAEFSLDCETGAVLGLELSEDSDIPSSEERVVPSAAIVTIGRDVIIVNDEVDGELSAGHPETAAGRSTASQLFSRRGTTATGEAAPAPTASESPSAPTTEPPPQPVVPSEPPVQPPAAPPTPSVGPDSETEQAASNHSANRLFQNAPGKYVLGRIAAADIVADDGTPIVSKGETVTQEVVHRAKSAGRFFELSASLAEE